MPHWTLVNNLSHQVMSFASEKKLRQYAKENGLAITRSYTDPHSFYTDEWDSPPSGNANHRSPFGPG